MSGPCSPLSPSSWAAGRPRLQSRHHCCRSGLFQVIVISVFIIKLISTQVLPSRRIETDERLDKKSRKCFYGSPCCSSVRIGVGCGQEQTTGSLACSLPGWGAGDLVSYMGCWRGCPEVQSQGGLSGSPSPQPVVLSGGHAQLPVLPQTLQKWQLGFVFVSFGPEFPAAHARSIFSPMSFLCIL